MIWYDSAFIVFASQYIDRSNIVKYITGNEVWIPGWNFADNNNQRVFKISFSCSGLI